MRSSVSFVLAFVTSQAVAQYTNQSAPFNLVLSSSNTTLNGALLGACHEGAAIEGLCLNIGSNSAAPYNQYTFNYTTQQTPDPVLGYIGILVRVSIVPRDAVDLVIHLTECPTSCGTTITRFLSIALPNWHTSLPLIF
jgi:hypothetical protein